MNNNQCHIHQVLALPALLISGTIEIFLCKKNRSYLTKIFATSDV